MKTQTNLKWLFVEFDERFKQKRLSLKEDVEYLNLCNCNIYNTCQLACCRIKNGFLVI